MTTGRIWGVIGAAVLLVVGAIGWHLRGCVTDQKAGVSEVGKCWLKVRTTTQKYYDEQSAFHDEADWFMDNIGKRKPTAASIEKDKRHLVSSVKTLDHDCNDVRSARYEFLRSWSNMENMFLVKHTNWGDISGLCAGWLPLAQELMAIDAKELASSDKARQDFYSTKPQIEDFSRNLQRNREAERRQASDIEGVFGNISNRSMFSNSWICMKIAFGSK